MKRLALALFLAVAFVPVAQPSSTVGTMRLDYYHTGNATQEFFSVDKVVIEPLPWPGHPDRAIDETNLGLYFFEVIDRKTNRVIYSRGFSSIFGEWQTTDEAKSVNKTFHESLRFPAPPSPVQVVLKRRDASHAFREIWSTLIDPADMFVDTSRPPSPGRLLELERNGDPADKVDLLILGDGYTAGEAAAFEAQARRLVEALFAVSPFKERRSDFNVWGLCPAAAESGVSRPSTGVHRNSPVGTTYDAFGSERYILTFENRAMRTIASAAPYEFIEILVNAETYGGGGIFGLFSTAAAGSAWAPYLFIHEFGHHFASLADEYYTSPVAYAPAAERVEPWEPNVTALLEPDRLKWRDLVEPGTPLATPWNKEAFEKYSLEMQSRRRKIRSERRPEAEMDALFREQQEQETRSLAAEKYAGKVGAFEGAMYEAKGYFRPQVDCVMFTRNEVGFCAVCRRGIEVVIDLYAGPPKR